MDNDFQVHKLVLAVHSSVFKAMFKSDSNETIENQMEMVDFDFNIVKIAFEIIYGRQIPALTMEQKMDVLKFSQKYDIQKLKVGLPRMALMLYGGSVILPFSGFLGSIPR